MKLSDAMVQAAGSARRHDIITVVVAEGIHANEEAERDADGESYGYCPESAVPTLYKHGRVVERIVPPPKRWFCIVADTWEVMDLGKHDSFCEADAEAESRNLESSFWITDEEGARELMANIQRKLNETKRER